MHGSCLCGRVTYQIRDTPRSVVGCHCTQCRKTSGHHVAATRVSSDKLDIQGGANITWYQSSDTAERGFCATCGSQLFWRTFGSPNTSVMAGTIDGDTGLTMDRQLYADTKGDYYALPDVAVVDPSTV